MAEEHQNELFASDQQESNIDDEPVIGLGPAIRRQKRPLQFEQAFLDVLPSAYMLIFGLDVWSIVITIFLILIPLLLFAMFVSCNIVREFKNHLGNLIIILPGIFATCQFSFRNLQNIVRKIKIGKYVNHFLEVMACPSDCLNGGGQIRPKLGQPVKDVIQLLETVYMQDSYASILYLMLPRGFKMVLRGKEIEHHNIVNDMMLKDTVHYRPHPGDGVPKDPNLDVVVTMGFVKDAKHHVDVQGFNVYHKNRLIKPFWKVWNADESDGRGVIGVLDANFVEPAHDKQGFEQMLLALNELPSPPLQTSA